MNRLEDTETIKNAFEVSGPLIERITAVCQGPNEANKWVELLSPEGSSSASKSRTNMSNSAVNLPPTPSHVSTKTSFIYRSALIFGIFIVMKKRSEGPGVGVMLIAQCASQLSVIRFHMFLLTFKWVKIDIFHTEINDTRQSWLLCAHVVVCIQSRCAKLHNHFSTKNASIDSTIRKSIGSFQEFS